MNPSDHEVIVAYRLDRAAESLRAAELLKVNGLLIPAMNRIYLW